MPLRPVRAKDIDAVSTWLSPVVQQLGCAWSKAEDLRRFLGAHEALLYTEDAGIAVLAHDSATPQLDAVRIRLLAVAPGQRRLGIGSRAALALERRLRASTARIYVLTPAQPGLALYFWLRLGYRPLTQRDWPARPERLPAIWMEREVARHS